MKLLFIKNLFKYEAVEQSFENRRYHLPVYNLQVDTILP